MAEINTTNVPEEKPPGNTWSYLILCCDDAGTEDTGPTGDAESNTSGAIRALQHGDSGFNRRPSQRHGATHQPTTATAARALNGTPLVSCIMPTYNRRRFVPQAIQYFLQQDYPERELIVVDDGTDAVNDLIPNDPSICYLRLNKRHSIGAKRNLARAIARGAIIVSWDDNDSYAPDRISYQVAPLLEGKADVTFGNASGSKAAAFPMRRSPRTVKGHRYQGPAASIFSLEPQDRGGGSINGNRGPKLDDTQRAGLMIKATVLDAPYLDMMVRHMIAQARYQLRSG